MGTTDHWPRWWWAHDDTRRLLPRSSVVVERPAQVRLWGRLRGRGVAGRLRGWAVRMILRTSAFAHGKYNGRPHDHDTKFDKRTVGHHCSILVKHFSQKRLVYPHVASHVAGPSAHRDAKRLDEPHHHLQGRAARLQPRFQQHHPLVDSVLFLKTDELVVDCLVRVQHGKLTSGSVPGLREEFLKLLELLALSLQLFFVRIPVSPPSFPGVLVVRRPFSVGPTAFVARPPPFVPRPPLFVLPPLAASIS